MKHGKYIALLVGYSGALMGSMQHDVFKKVLDNGMTILVRPVKTAQKVSVQLWYNVGSKDEKAGERGLAHLLEHMIFKGTTRLSETDIPEITHKLSGKCNAATSYDWTNYHFELPVQHWQPALTILADCMRNCTFKPDILNAEFKAVIQELKMNRDNTTRAITGNLMASIFADHPYHYPVIGFKQDLWTVTSENLHAFYAKHYVPNNAVLVVVGDVDPATVFSVAEQQFGAIARSDSYAKESFYYNRDITAQQVTVFRDRKNAEILIAWVVPGLRQGVGYTMHTLSNVLGGGRSSRLSRRLLDELQLVNDVSVSGWDCFDHSILWIYAEPKTPGALDSIIATVQEEIAALADQGPSEQELTTAVKQLKSEWYDLMELNYHQGAFIGKYYLALGDEHALFTMMHDDMAKLARDIKDIAQRYCSPRMRHVGILMPVDQAGREEFLQLQYQSDEEDRAFLAQRIRQSSVEPGVYVNQVKVQQAPIPEPIIPHAWKLDNGLKVIAYKRSVVPKVHIELQMKAGRGCDNQQLPGLTRILMYLLSEGTEHYDAQALALALESRGIQLSIGRSITMTMLNSDVEYALQLLVEILTKSRFDQTALEKVKIWALSDYQHYLDSPDAIADHVARQVIYKNHPYQQQGLADEQTIAKITRDDVVSWYKKIITPQEAVLSVVGDVDEGELAGIIKRTLGQWQGPVYTKPVFPVLERVQPATITYPLNRDQVLLVFAGLSVHRLHPDYDKLVLFDYLFSHGLHSRLYKLRQQYGIFYRAGGSLVSGADKQPGMAYITALVSKDQLAQAEELFRNVIDTAVDSITKEELEQAQRHLLNAPADFYSTNASVASTLLFLDHYGLLPNYFGRRAQALSTITIDDVKRAVKSVFSTDRLVTIKVGRV